MSLEVGRRAVHASGAGIPLVYLLGVGTWQQVQYLLIFATAIALSLEFLRIVVGLNHAIYDRLTREYERDALAGYALYMLSMTAVGLVFAPPVAVPGMLMLALGDPVSGLLGSNSPHEHKAPRVWIAMFSVSFVLAAIVIVPAVGGAPAIAAAALGAFGATVADGIKPIVWGVPIDDNLTIPPAASLLIAVVLSAVGVPIFEPLVIG